jgi:hypothetical protein
MRGINISIGPDYAESCLDFYYLLIELGRFHTYHFLTGKCPPPPPGEGGRTRNPVIANTTVPTDLILVIVQTGKKSRLDELLSRRIQLKTLEERRLQACTHFRMASCSFFPFRIIIERPMLIFATLFLPLLPAYVVITFIYQTSTI